MAETPKKTVKAPVAKTQIFDGELVKVSLAISKGCKAEMSVLAEPKLLNAAHQEAIKKIGKNISIPGFRKGKVPLEILKKNYGPNIEGEWKTEAVQKALDQALTLAAIRPLDYRSIKPDLESFSKDNAKIKFSFESYPQVPAIDISQIKLTTIEHEDISPERIDEVIDVMRTYKAKWETLNDQNLEEGFFADIDVINLENNTKLVSQKRVEVSKGKLSEWLHKVLIGMKKDESKEATSKWDKTMPEAEKKDFQATKCKVTVLSVLKGDLPEVNDELAKSMGTQSVADLKTQVLLRLNQNAEQAADNKQRHLLDKELVKLADFDLPQSLIEAEYKTKLQIKEQELQQMGSSKESIEKELKKHDGAALDNALNSLKIFFILQKIANENNIAVTEEELKDAMSNRLSQLNLPPEISSNAKYKSHLMQELRMNCFIDILTHKVKTHLIKKVVSDK